MSSEDSEKSGSHKLLALERRLYLKIPSHLRFFLLPIKRMHSLVKVLRLNLWIITGVENLSKEKLIVFYAGSSAEIEKNFFAKLIFDGSFNENNIGKAWLWNIIRSKRQISDKCSLMVVESPWFFCKFFKRKKDFFVPFWILGKVDSSLPLTRTVKSDKQKAKKNNLHFELTNELPKFHDFYYNMHVPYINKAHGLEAIIEDYNSMKAKFNNGELLLLKNENEYIGGMLLYYTQNQGHLYVLGIKNGEIKYVNDGAIGAMYYFAIQYLKEKGYKYVYLGESRAFLNYGVLQFKKKRNMQINQRSEMGFLIRPISKIEGVKGFFMKNPFIYTDKINFKSAVFVENDQLLSREDFEQIYKNYYLKGISELIIYRFGKVNNVINENIPPEYSDKIAICSADNLF